MAFARARTALAALEEKLRRQLGLAGEIGAQFDPRLTPVIIAGDLRDAGNAANTGRAFAWSGIVANFYSIRPEQDVLITGIMVSVAGASNAFAYVTTAGQGSAVGAAVMAAAPLEGTWTDRKLIAGDQAPLTVGSGALLGTAVSTTTRILFVNGAATQFVPQNLMLPAGSFLNLSAAVGWTVLGRIWP